MAVLLMGMLGACGTLKQSASSGMAEGEITDADFSKYAGKYTSEDDDTIKISEDGSVEINITRLCSMEGTADPVYKGIMPIHSTDPEDNVMRLEFNTKTKELIVTDSSWNYLMNGSIFSMDA